MAVTHSLALSEIGNDGIWSYAPEATTLGTGATDVENRKGSRGTGSLPNGYLVTSFGQF